jgi:predicted lipoprotein with Yx(FWY)xxD motif
MQTRPMALSALAAVTLFAAACGSAPSTTSGSGPYSSPASSPYMSPASSPASTPSAGAATIAVASNSSLGQILVDGKGMTVYLFEKDSGTTSACYGSCAAVWPPVLTGGAPQAGTGANASLLGTTKRTDGTVEVTYAGHPLYYFVRDKAPGDATGQGVNGFGALWWVMSPSGAAVKAKGSAYGDFAGQA